MGSPTRIALNKQDIYKHFIISMFPKQVHLFVRKRNMLVLIADGALKLIAGVLEALVEYTPSIVDSIFQFLIAVLEGVAKNLPGLIQAAIDVLMAFFSGRR